MDKNLTALSAVEEKCYTIEALTPVTMHGATGKNAEFRLSSLKGMMRYWFRLLSSHESEKMMHEKEDELFGHVLNKASKSSVWLTLNEPADTRTAQFRPSSSGDFFIDAIKEGSEWEACLSAKNSQKHHLKTAEAVFEAAVLLGGFGQRGRHGASAFHLVDHPLTDARDYLNKLASLMDELDVEAIIDEETHRIFRQSGLGTRADRPYWLETKVIISGLQENADQILRGMRSATHENAGRYRGVLGNFNPRFPAPLHTSVVKLEDGYAVTVSEMNHRNNRGYQEAKTFYETELYEKLKHLRKDVR